MNLSELMYTMLFTLIEAYNTVGEDEIDKHNLK